MREEHTLCPKSYHLRGDRNRHAGNGQVPEPSDALKAAGHLASPSWSISRWKHLESSPSSPSDVGTAMRHLPEKQGHTGPRLDKLGPAAAKFTTRRILWPAVTFHRGSRV